MKHHRRSRRDKEKGSTVIEFGLCFLLVFGFIYAVFEFGRVVYSYNVLAGEHERRRDTRWFTEAVVAHGPLRMTLAREWHVGRLDSIPQPST